MSEQCISQRSSDFSIARILSTNNISSNNYQKKQLKVNQGLSNDLPTKKKKTFECVPKGAEQSQDIPKEEKDQKFGLLKRQLPWLQCTRYSPPKLPRRPSTTKQRKRRLGSHPRIPFTKFQIQVLEEKYKINAYLSRRDVIQLGGILNLPQNRVKIWFQNRRARERKESQSNNISID
ncbi:homeobox protein MSX-2 [Leptopilina heterotoma]|uniref:homeobox protein MSX-2 n=1 Tax=Leptopilina heterotoma TaxID=63436 RepID=UPI001CA987E9|nr:homeobox protein MSX-2 [Leptopilina heterotoma]